MRVERADAEAVRQRLAELRRRAEGDTGSVIATTDTGSALQEYEERLAREAAESAAREKAKKQQRKEAKEKERQAQELEEMDPEIAAIMGFGGFKSKKN
jgi:U4/U6.U5 tri-snRNP component SNU23